MHESWTEARKKYQYPEDCSIDLATFEDADKYEGWFDCSFRGDFQSTKVFQHRFRKNAPYCLTAWYEVVYWKLYSQNKGNRRNRITKGVIRNIKDSGVTAKDLYTLCQNYVESGDLQDFKAFLDKMIKASSKEMAVAATFPAFLNPEKFPMVDREITKWAQENSHRHSYACCGGPVLEEAPVLKKGSVNALRYTLVKHRNFVESWIKWCRFTASKLHVLTGDDWSARDVEMAVFTAERRSDLTLKPLVDK